MNRKRAGALATIAGFTLSAVNVLSASAFVAPVPSPYAQAAPGHGEDAVSVRTQRRPVLTGRSASNFSGEVHQPLSACSAAWRVVDNQDWTWTNALEEMSAQSPTNIWAVGTALSPVTGYLVNSKEHWDGKAWSSVAGVVSGTEDSYLTGVVAIDADNNWAVGVTHVNGIPEGSFHSWGTGSTVNSWDPNPTMASVLNDVAATSPDNVLMVGSKLEFYQGSRTWKTMIKRYHGGLVDLIDTPNLGTGDNTLLGITVVSPTDIWAVGYYRATPTGPRRTLFERSSDGITWTVVPSPNLGSGNNTLVRLSSASSTDFWAVGYTGSTSAGRLLLEHWANGIWTIATPINPGAYTDVLSDIVATSSTTYTAVGFYAQSASLYLPLVGTYNGSSWSYSNPARSGSSDNLLLGVAAPAAGDLWAVGTYVGPQGLGRNLIENYSGLGAPSAVTATPGDGSAAVSWTPPCGDGGSAITSYVVTAYDGCSVHGSVTVAGTSAAFTGLTNGIPYTFKVEAVNGFGASAQSSASSAVTPNGTSAPAWASACSTRQYRLGGSDGQTWQAMDSTRLSVSFTPSVDSYAVLGGNADLWTANLGYNQDIGVAVTGGAYPTAAGQPEAWKESGGFAGTFSPNAAYVQAVIPVLASTTYTAALQWKSNKPDGGSIYAGAGPIGAAFSPTRLTVQLIPVSATRVFTKTSSLQYSLSASDGAAWQDIDPTNLTLPFTPPSGTWRALVSGGADLFTSTAGYNQDIGVTLSGGTYPTVSGQPETWKESGGLAGTFSPNAAFAQADFSVAGGTAYAAKLQWKTNKPDSGTIWAGAGPIGGQFSPTTLTVILVPVDSALLGAWSSTHQWEQLNSDGILWPAFTYYDVTPTTGTIGQGPYTWITPTADSDYAVSVNSDLWTSVAGYNQDLGIMVSGGAYGPGTLVAWKESGGGAAFSPNAAFVTTVLHLQNGIQYTVMAVWKANRIAQSANAIWAGAGPGPGNFVYSPTWLTAIALS